MLPLLAAIELDPVALAAFGGMAAAITALWVRSEKCVTDRQKTAEQIRIMDRRFTKLVGRLAACKTSGCQFSDWSKEELEEDDDDEFDNHPKRPGNARSVTSSSNEPPPHSSTPSPA